MRRPTTFHRAAAALGALALAACATAGDPLAGQVTSGECGLEAVTVKALGME